MNTGQPMKRRIHLRLIHNGVPPSIEFDESARFGLEDVKGEVPRRLTQRGEPQNLDFVIEVDDGDEAPMFSWVGSAAAGTDSPSACRNATNSVATARAAESLGRASQ
jgi:hypothetical protein